MVVVCTVESKAAVMNRLASYRSVLTIFEYATLIEAELAVVPATPPDKAIFKYDGAAETVIPANDLPVGATLKPSPPQARTLDVIEATLVV